MATNNSKKGNAQNKKTAQVKDAAQTETKQAVEPNVKAEAAAAEAAGEKVVKAAKAEAKPQAKKEKSEQKSGEKKSDKQAKGAQTSKNTDAQPTTLEEAVKQLAEYKDKWIRSVAEFDNYRKRTGAVKSESYLSGRADIMVKLFPIGDSIDRAMATIADEKTLKGLELISKSFKQLLENEFYEEINPIGQSFDAATCEAIMAVDAAEGEKEGIVKQVYTKGYKRGDKVIRYAQVVVTK